MRGPHLYKCPHLPALLAVTRGIVEHLSTVSISSPLPYSLLMLGCKLYKRSPLPYSPVVTTLENTRYVIVTYVKEYWYQYRRIGPEYPSTRNASFHEAHGPRKQTDWLGSTVISSQTLGSPGIKLLSPVVSSFRVLWSQAL